MTSTQLHLFDYQTLFATDFSLADRFSASDFSFAESYCNGVNIWSNKKPTLARLNYQSQYKYTGTYKSPRCISGINISANENYFPGLKNESLKAGANSREKHTFFS